MKILMLPAWFPNKLELSRLHAVNYNLYTSYFSEQADSVHRYAGIKIDLLMPKIYAVTKLPRLRSFPVWGVDINKREGGENWVGYYPYFLRRSRPGLWRHFGEKLFLDYVKKNGMPDMLWSCGVLWSAFLANHLHRKYKIPYFIVEHTDMQMMDKGTKKSNRVKNEVVRLFQEAAFGAACCTDAANRMKRFLGDEVQDIKIVYNVLAPPFEQIETPLPNKPTTPFVYHNTARIDDNKNHATLIDAFAELRRKLPNVKLNIAGEGVNFEKIQKQIQQLKLEEHVVLLRQMGREDLTRQLLKSSAFISASHSETFNISLIEALSCGLPCVSTPTGIAADAIDASNGIITESSSKEDLLKGMLHVHEHCHTYDSQNIRNQVIGKFTGATVAQQLRDNLSNSANGGLNIELK